MTHSKKWIQRFLTAAVAALLATATVHAQADETITYIHWDALGSPVAATDEAGNVVWREAYRPYGERINNEAAASPHSRWYTGHPQDDDTGLVYAGARYYDPVVGRFLAIDPVEFQEDNVHSFNRYVYGSNNPYRYIDPDGRFALDTVVDAGFVVYDTGRFLGAAAAYGVGTATGNGALRDAGRQGMTETGLDLTGSAVGMAIPFASSAATRGVVRGAKGAGDVSRKGGSGGGRQDNFFRELDESGGAPHTVFRRNPKNRRIENYETFDRTGAAGGNRRFRGTGRSHGGVEPPLVLEPKPGHPGGRPYRARPARQNEIPLGF